MRLTGRLEDLGLGEILHVLGAARRSGVLHVRSGGVETILVFRQGAIVGARHPDLPSSLAELLERAGSAPTVAAPALEREAIESNVGLLEIVARRGGSEAIGWLETAVEGIVGSLIASGEGTFDFTLVGDSSPPPPAPGGLVLPHGLPHGRLVAAPASRAAPDRLDRRAARLRVPEAKLALPTRKAEPRKPPPPIAAGHAALPAAGAPSRRLLLLALGAGAVRRSIEAHARAVGCDVRHVASLAEADLAVESATQHGLSVAAIGQTPHASLTGVELIARIKSLDRAVPCALIADTAAPASRIALARERASALGAQVVALVASDLPADEARVIAQDLLERLFGAEEGASPASPVGLPESASGADVLFAGAAVEPGRADEPVDMIALAQGVAVTSEATEVALALLVGASGFFDRAALLVRAATGLKLMGALVPHGDRPPESLVAGRSLAAMGDDVVARAVHDGLPFIGPPPTDRPSAEILRILGAERPGRIAVIPLLEGGQCIAVLYGDDAGDEDGRRDLAPLLGFLRDMAAPYHAARDAAARRIQARGLREVSR